MLLSKQCPPRSIFKRAYLNKPLISESDSLECYLNMCASMEGHVMISLLYNGFNVVSATNELLDLTVQ